MTLNPARDYGEHVTESDLEAVQAELDPTMAALGFTFASAGRILEHGKVVAHEYAWDGSVPALTRAFPRVAEHVEYLDTSDAAVTIKVVVPVPPTRAHVHVDGAELISLDFAERQGRSPSAIQDSLAEVAAAIRARSVAEQSGSR